MYRMMPFYASGLMGIGLDEYYSRQACKEDMSLVDRLVKDHRRRVRTGEPRIPDPDSALPYSEPIIVDAVLKGKPIPSIVPSDLKADMAAYDLPLILKREFLRTRVNDSLGKSLITHLLEKDRKALEEMRFDDIGN